MHETTIERAFTFLECKIGIRKPPPLLILFALPVIIVFGLIGAFFYGLGS